MAGSLPDNGDFTDDDMADIPDVFAIAPGSSTPYSNVPPLPQSSFLPQPPYLPLMPPFMPLSPPYVPLYPPPLVAPSSPLIHLPPSFLAPSPSSWPPPPIQHNENLFGNFASVPPVLFRNNEFYKTKYTVCESGVLMHSGGPITLADGLSAMRHYMKEHVTHFSLTPAECSTITRSALRQQSVPDDDSAEITSELVILIGSYSDSSALCDDIMPLDLHIRVNEVHVQLPPLRFHDFEQRRICKHIVISTEAKLMPFVQNCITINWIPEMDKLFYWTVCVGTVLHHQAVFREVFSSNSIDRDTSLLQIRNLVRHGNERGDNSLTVRFSVICPLTGSPIEWPGKGRLCDHIQMFDVLNYIKNNEAHLSWLCPICYQHVPPEQLEISQYVLYDVIRSDRLPSDCEEIEFDMNGMWYPSVYMQSYAYDGIVTPNAAGVPSTSAAAAVAGGTMQQYGDFDNDFYSASNFAVHNDGIDLTMGSRRSTRESDDIQQPQQQQQHSDDTETEQRIIAVIDLTDDD